jgi:hypothetical protein
MINELDLVVLLNDYDAYGLKSGDVGTVVHCYQDKKGFEVEFVTADGQTINVLTLTDAGIRPFALSEILHTRELKSLAA